MSYHHFLKIIYFMLLWNIPVARADCGAWSLAVNNYLKSNPGQTADTVDPMQIVEYIKLNNYNIFSSNVNLNGYVVQGKEIFLADKSIAGGYIDFNTQTCAQTSGTLSSVFGGDSIEMGNDTATVTQYTFNAAANPSEVSSRTYNNNIINSVVAIDFTQDAYDLNGNNKGGNAFTAIKSAIATYSSSYGNPSSLRVVFGINDPNIIFNNTSITQETMSCVQNGQAYIVKYDTSTGQTYIKHATAAGLGFISGDIGANFAITGNKLTYELDVSKINRSKTADQNDLQIMNWRL